MKPKSALRSFLLLAGSSLLAASSLHAATLTWDANGATAAQTDGAAVSGNWDTGTNWWTGSTNVSWTSGVDAVFGNGGVGGAVGLTAPTGVGSLTINYFTGTYTLGTALQALTINNGITKNASPGTLALAGPLVLGAAQTWTNNSTTGFQASGAATLDTGGFNLTFDGAGSFNLSPSGGNTLLISGAGGIIKNGTGDLTLDSNPQVAHTFTGNIVVNGGSIGFQTPNTFFTGKNTTLNGGYLGGRFNSDVTWTSGLGTGANQIQITGGVSGFSGESNSDSVFTIGTALSTLKWGASGVNGATGFFNPTELLLNGSARMNANGTGPLNNGIDLNGSNRTFTSNHTNWDGASATGGVINGAIINTAGTAAGIIRTGIGNLSLIAANTYDGATTINGGTLTLRSSGTINSTSALNLGGGTLRLVNTAQVNRFADVAVNVSAGGGISYENTNTAAITYTETLGAVTVSGGLLNVVQNTNQSTSNGQTLTFGTSGSTNLTQSGTGSVAFSALTTGPQATGNKNMFMVFGAGTTTAGQIVGPWATVGTAANAQTDYAAYNADYVVPAAIAGSAETTWLVATDPYTMDFSTAGTTLTATRNIGALRIAGGIPLTSVDFGPAETITLTGHTFVDGNTVIFGPGAPGGLTVGTTYFVVSAAVDTFKVSATNGGAPVNLTSAGTAPTVVLASATTLALSTGNNLGTNGILNGSPYAISITPGTGGSVTLPTTSAGNLYVTTGSNAITIDAPITNNTGALTLVKNGSGTLLLRAANNAYTGDTIINSGTLQIGNGNPGTTGTLNAGAYGGNIYIAGGVTMNQFLIGTQTFSGVISGDGNLVVGYTTLTLGNSNTYTGRTSLIPQRSGGGGQLNVASFNSVFTDAVLGTTHSASSSLGAPTTIANGTIQIGSGSAQSGATIKYTGSGETTDRIINFQYNNTGVTLTLDTSGSGGSGLLKFTSAPISNGTAGHVTLQGSTNGELAQGLPFALTNFTKSGAGTWTLGGAVGNTGTTTISAGKLVINGTQANSGAIAVNGTSTLGGSGSLGGAVTVTASANLSPGASAGTAGTLTMRSTLSIAALAGAANAGKLDYDLGPIASSDKIAVAGTLTIGTDLLRFSDFNFTALGGLQNGTYKLITSGAAVSGTLDTTPANLTGTIGAGPASGTLQISGNDIELVVTGAGGGPGPVDHFVISAIGSPQTVGTPITGITITAQDSSNATATGFTGTVTFGGTGGFSGTSGSFTLGVLSGVSVTPTLAGSNLTFTVDDDGGPSIGTTTITTIQTQYVAWSGGALFDVDANGDGVKNGMAFLLGASGPNAAVTLPTVTESGGKLVMTFDCLSATNRGSAVLNLQYSKDLGITDLWSSHTAAVPGTAPVTTTVNNVTFNTTVNGPLIHVVAEVPASAATPGGKLFGRLNAVTTP